MNPIFPAVPLALALLLGFGDRMPAQVPQLITCQGRAAVGGMVLSESENAELAAATGYLKIGETTLTRDNERRGE